MEICSTAPRQLEIDQIFDKIEGRVVLITGAAGSIGSELCRQVARFNPAAIVAFDAGETPCSTFRGMRERFPGVVFHAGSERFRTGSRRPV